MKRFRRREWDVGGGDAAVAIERAEGARHGSPLGRLLTAGVVLAAAATIGADAALIGVSPEAWRASAAQWSSDATLIGRVAAEDPDVAAAATQALYERVRAGALDDAALAAAAKAMWFGRVSADPQVRAGGPVPISVMIQSPSVIDDFADGRQGPEIEWRLTAVDVDGTGPLALPAAAATRTPLSKFSPTVWSRAELPVASPPGEAEVRFAVEFAVRAMPGGAIVGRWTQHASQRVDVFPAAVAAER